MKYEFSDNIQRGMLYLLKSDRDFFSQIVNLVKPEYFEYDIHANLFRTVSAYYNTYKKLPTDDFILEEVKSLKPARQDLSDYLDELEYINTLDTSCVSNPDYFMDIVEDFAKKEAMKSAITESVLLLKEDKIGDIEGIVRKALTVSRFVDNGQDYFSSVSDRWDRIINKKEEKKYSTVLPSLDKSLEGGLGIKELAMVVAPPGVGKSLYLVNQAVRGLMDGNNILYISLEMAEDKIAQRFDSIMSLIPQKRLKEPTGQLDLKERLEIFQKEFDSRLVIKEFPTSTATVNTVRALLTQLANYEEFVPDMIIVDYLELLRPTREIQHEYQAQQRIAEELRGLAMENSLLVWTATQTNRMGRAVSIITDAELGDSYGKIRTCDFAISLNQKEEEFEEGTMRSFVMKSRNGRPRFIVPMTVDYSTLRMGEDTGFNE
jgi:replicative DNA helicase